MGTFALWLETRKNNINEHQIDDHMLVALLNETYNANRKLITRLVETEDVAEIEEKLKQKSPSIYSRVRNMGPKAMLAALLAITGVGTEVGSKYLDAVGQSRQLAGPHAAAVKGLQGMERRGNLADRNAIADLNRLGRAEVEKMQSDAAVERNDDDRMDHLSKYGQEGQGFGYTDDGSIHIPKYTGRQQWELMQKYAQADREREAKYARERAARDKEHEEYVKDQLRQAQERNRARNTTVRVGDDGKITVRNPTSR